MKNNSNFNIAGSSQSLFIDSSKGKLVECSVSFCHGTGSFAPSIRMFGCYSINSVNYSLNECKNEACSATFGNGTILYINAYSNVALNQRIIKIRNDTVLYSNFINNTESTQGIIFCEGDCTNIIRECSLVQNNGAAGFYANLYPSNSISHMIVSNCSMIDNKFSKNYIVINPSIVEYYDNTDINFKISIPFRVNCEEFSTIYIYIESQIPCPIFSLQFLFMIAHFIFMNDF